MCFLSASGKPCNTRRRPSDTRAKTGICGRIVSDEPSALDSQQKRLDVGGNRRRRLRLGCPRRGGPAKLPRPTRTRSWSSSPGVRRSTLPQSGVPVSRSAAPAPRPIRCVQRRLRTWIGDASRVFHRADFAPRPAFCRIHPCLGCAPAAPLLPRVVPAPSALPRLIFALSSDACKPACRLIRSALRCNFTPFTLGYGDSRVFR